MANAIRSPQADQDLADIADTLAQRSPRLALRFIDAAEETFAKLTEMPGLGAKFESSNPRLDGLQVWPVKQFPNHLIFYRSRDQRIEIVRVLHGARDLENLPPS